MLDVEEQQTEPAPVEIPTVAPAPADDIESLLAEFTRATAKPEPEANAALPEDGATTDQSPVADNELDSLLEGPRSRE
jgi:hypothetical protein